MKKLSLGLLLLELVGIIGCVLFILIADAEASPYGPYEATVVYVADGDTVEAVISTWPQQYVQTRIRVRGVDTPEKGGYAQCDAERELAAKATAFATEMLLSKDVTVVDVGLDKYGGRYVADLIMADGTRYSTKLIEAGYAVAYDGGTKTKPWCQ